MHTWIFQGNPDEFDLDAYLASRPAQVVWLVTRYATEIAFGDRVYLWRNQGSRNALPGIVAEGIIIAEPKVREENPEAVRFWRENGPRATAPQMRAVMRLARVATKKEVLRADWCSDDPVLSDLPNLRMRAATNYRLSEAHAARLAALWSRTGQDWTRNEAVAGLTAYVRTYGQPVSRLPTSQIAAIALRIGRAVGSVYAKVMNFRSLDPRAGGEGMSGAGAIDRSVWTEFFDDQSDEVRVDALESEFRRLWGSSEQYNLSPPQAAADASLTAEEADRLERLSLPELLAKYVAQQVYRRGRPSTRVLTARSYDRNPLVIAIARLRASHRCEVRDCAHPPFETSEGAPYTEVHHIVPLAEGGEDTIQNVVCLCPSHHREVHLGARGPQLTAELKTLRADDAS